MHRYSSNSNSNTTPTSSFSMFFSRPDPQPFEDYDSYPSTIMSSPVDCTLSLGTPSTRQKKENRHQRSSSSSSNLSWDMFHTKKPSKSNGGSSRGNNTSSSTSSNTSVLNNMSGGDPLLARRCANCDTTSTPLWRNGPRGPKSLCNACGIRYKKEERRAAATNNGATAAAVMEQQHYLNHHHQHTWGHHQGNEFRFLDDDNDRDSPFLSWRLNVPDRSSLVHDYT